MTFQVLTIGRMPIAIGIVLYEAMYSKYHTISMATILSTPIQLSDRRIMQKRASFGEQIMPIRQSKPGTPCTDSVRFYEPFELNQ